MEALEKKKEEEKGGRRLRPSEGGGGGGAPPPPPKKGRKWGTSNFFFLIHQPLPTLIMPPDKRRGCSLRAERRLARAKTSKGQEAGAGSC